MKGRKVNQGGESKKREEELGKHCSEEVEADNETVKKKCEFQKKACRKSQKVQGAQPD